MSSPEENRSDSVLATAIYQILKSLAKFSIGYGLSATAMAELVRRAYLDAAEELIKDRGEKTLTTKICAMTGLYRKEIIRLRNLPPLAANSPDERYNRSVRVITGWIRDADFQAPLGTPAALSLQGPASFTELVKRYSGDMSPTAMQEEFLRLGIVTITDQDTLELTDHSYLASTDTEGVRILGTDTADLINTISYNLSCDKNERHFQRKVTYVSIPAEHSASFRQYSTEQSQKLLEKLDRWLAKHDNNKSYDQKFMARLGVGIYQIEELHSDNERSEDNH